MSFYCFWAKWYLLKGKVERAGLLWEGWSINTPLKLQLPAGSLARSRPLQWHHTEGAQRCSLPPEVHSWNITAAAQGGKESATVLLRLESNFSLPVGILTNHFAKNLCFFKQSTSFFFFFFLKSSPVIDLLFSWNAGLCWRGWIG